jgi:hypothetical protein
MLSKNESSSWENLGIFPKEVFHDECVSTVTGPGEGPHIRALLQRCHV